MTFSQWERHYTLSGTPKRGGKKSWRKCSSGKTKCSKFFVVLEKEWFRPHFLVRYNPSGQNGWKFCQTRAAKEGVWRRSIILWRYDIFYAVKIYHKLWRIEKQQKRKQVVQVQYFLLENFGPGGPWNSFPFNSQEHSMFSGRFDLIFHQQHTTEPNWHMCSIAGGQQL